jgi:hypothetical protein
VYDWATGAFQAALGFTAEDVANKASSLSTSTTLYPTVKAVKDVTDTLLVANQTLSGTDYIGNNSRFWQRESLQIASGNSAVHKMSFRIPKSFTGDIYIRARNTSTYYPCYRISGLSLPFYVYSSGQSAGTQSLPYVIGGYDSNYNDGGGSNKIPMITEVKIRRWTNGSDNAEYTLDFTVQASGGVAINWDMNVVFDGMMSAAMTGTVAKDNGASAYTTTVGDVGITAGLTTISDFWTITDIQTAATRGLSTMTDGNIGGNVDGIIKKIPLVTAWAAYPSNPSLTLGGGTVNSFTSPNCNYYVVDKLVFFMMNITWTSITTPSGSFLITNGLPVATSNTTNLFPHFSVGISGVDYPTGALQIACRGQANSRNLTVSFFKDDAATVDATAADMDGAVTIRVSGCYIID